MLDICPDCRCRHELPDRERDNTDPLRGMRCPACHAAHIARIESRTNIPGASEKPKPPEFDTVSRPGYKYSGPPRLKPLSGESSKELHAPTPIGVLPSQPDGLTFRQRAGQKSIS